MMPASNACSPFIKHIYASGGGPPSESTSEISSVDSDWSDLKTIAVQLGITNSDDLVTERFKVDRTKLEDMIRTDTASNGMNRAEEFFDTIMKETSTFIGWPCRLKLGARTKKDPHVRIVGLPEDVLKAKERVMAHLDSRGNRVIMKMDVSYTDHSFIIGRSGNNIRRIMEETATHIHFPDSNRSNPIEKSNQVSLCGNLEGVEKARFLVRVSAPLVISFELPIIAPGYPVPDNDTDYVKEIETKFCVQVIFSTRPKLHSALVLIKGSEREYLKVKQATQILIGRICENITGPISVQMQLEISVQHHFVVAGKNSDNLRAIMKKTGTEIMFPDAGDMNIKPIKRSQVTITGTIDGVYLARQQLIGTLPIVLIFDYPENTIDSEKIAKIMKALDVFINVRQKTRQSTLCVVIKGIEKFIDKIYEARHQILALNTPKVVPNIPSTYFSSQDGKISISALLATPTPLTPTSPLTPTHPDFLFSNTNWNILQQESITQLRNQFARASVSSPTVCASASSTSAVGGSHNSPMPPNMNRFLHPNSYTNTMQRNNYATSNTSDYQSFSSGSTSLEHSFPGSSGSNNSISAHVSPDTTSNYYSGGSGSNANESNESNNQSNEPLLYEYERKKIFGLKSMEIPPVAGEMRVPTPTWVGMQLSRTSPLPDYSSNPMWNRNTASPYNLGVTTSLLDITPKSNRHNLSQFNDLHSLLTKLGLDHYIKTFSEHEIDFQVFQSLSDSDLQSLGITALGARRKLLLAIRDIAANQCRSPKPNENQPQFSGSAAPGAERKLSTRW